MQMFPLCFLQVGDIFYHHDHSGREFIIKDFILDEVVSEDLGSGDTYIFLDNELVNTKEMELKLCN